MKTLVNTTPGIWVKEIYDAVKYVYGNPDSWGIALSGCSLVLEQEGLEPLSITGFGKYTNDSISPLSAIAGIVDADNNINLVCITSAGEKIRHHLQNTDKIYLITS